MGDVRYRLANGNREHVVSEEKFKAMQKKHPGSFIKLGPVKEGKEVKSAPAVPAAKASTKAPKPVKTGK